jgi:drug/metabolite transporter (DMT)-like permease
MNDDRRGIFLVLLGMVIFSFQDVIIRELSDYASLIQIMFIRGLIGGLILLLFLKVTKRSISFGSAYPLLSTARVLLFFTGFLCFYFALGEMELAEATSLFFISPLFITLFSKFIFKTRIGIYRIFAVIVGFIGVLFIVKPNPQGFNLVALLPILTAFTYSISMLIAKYTCEKDTVFQQMLHLYWGSVFLAFVAWLILPFIEFQPSQAKSLEYLIRDWTFYNDSVVLLLLAVGVIGSAGMILLTMAYRIASPPVIAPFEYILLILAIGNGFWFYSEIPDVYSIVGMLLITSSGLFIFIRESLKKDPVAIETSLRT